MRRSEQDLFQGAAYLGAHARTARQRRVKGGHAPVETSRRRFDGAGQRGSDHHGVGAAGDGLGDVAAPAHAAVGDHVHVHAGLIEVAHARTGDVGDRGRLGNTDAEHRARRAGVARSHAHEHTGGAGAHEVQCGLVARAAADDHRQFELADELLQVERLDGLRDVFRRDDGPLDDEDVETGVQDGLGHPVGARGRDRRRGGDAGALHLRDALGDQFDLDRLQVHLLHPGRRLVVVEFADLFEERHRVLVTGPETLEVQDAESTEATELDRGVGRHGPVHRRTEDRQVELVGVDLPGDVDVLGIARAPRRHDGDVVEAVGLSRRFIDTDLYFCHGDLRLRNSQPKNGLALLPIYTKLVRIKSTDLPQAAWPPPLPRPMPTMTTRLLAAWFCSGNGPRVSGLV